MRNNSRGCVRSVDGVLGGVGVLATVRLENFRDGLDDLWYVKLYEKKFGKKPDIPESLVRDLRDFSRDPVRLAAWRDAIADALEQRPGDVIRSGKL